MLSPYDDEEADFLEKIGCFALFLLVIALILLAIASEPQ
jgi:hypothetical protein